MAFLATCPTVGFLASGISRAAAAALGTLAHRGVGRGRAPAFRSFMERVCQASAVIPLAVSPPELEGPRGAPASPALSCAMVAPLTVPRLWLLSQGDVWWVPAWAGCPQCPPQRGKSLLGWPWGTSSPWGALGTMMAMGEASAPASCRVGGLAHECHPLSWGIALALGPGGQGEPWQRGEHLKQSPLCPAEHPSLSLSPRQDAVAAM